MEKRVNSLFILFAASVTIVNSSISLLRTGGDFFALLQMQVTIPLCGTLLFIVLQQATLRVQRYAHTIFVFLVAAISILDDFSASYGLGFAVIGFYLAQKYGFFIKNSAIKSLLTLIVIIVLVEISALSEGVSGVGLDIALFVVFFFSVFYFGDQETLLRFKEREDALKERIDREFGSGVDLKKIGFTEREIEVGAVLCQTLGTDKEIAYDLNISKNTVINHLRSMREKAGVRDRQHLISIIRSYYIRQDDYSEKLKSEAG